MSYFNYKVKTNVPLKTTIDPNCMLMFFKMFSTSWSTLPRRSRATSEKCTERSFTEDPTTTTWRWSPLLTSLIWTSCSKLQRQAGLFATLVVISGKYFGDILHLHLYVIHVHLSTSGSPTSPPWPPMTTTLPRCGDRSSPETARTRPSSPRPKCSISFRRPWTKPWPNLGTQFLSPMWLTGY